MFAIILVQTATAHFAIVNVEQSQEIHNAMPFIFELLTLNLAWTHGLSRLCSLERLQVRFLIQGQSDFVVCSERFGPFI